MHLSRLLAAASAAFLLAATAAMPQPAQAREIVGSPASYSRGTGVVKPGERPLFYVLGGGKAVPSPGGVGRPGKKWPGTAMITGMHLKPAWSPPAEVKH